MKKNMIILSVVSVLLLIFYFGLQSNNSKNEGSMEYNFKFEEMMKEDSEAMMEDNSESTMEEEKVAMNEVPMMNDGILAPTFMLNTLEGEEIDLSELKGEKVLIKFWASWCPICLSGLDEIDQLSGEMNDFKVLTIVSPNYNGEQSLENFRAWYKTRMLENLTVLIDEDGTIARTYGVRGYPSYAFIGSDGVLVRLIPGHIGNEKIKEAFEYIK